MNLFRVDMVRLSCRNATMLGGLFVWALVLVGGAAGQAAKTSPAPAQQQLVILDTDIGDDIDDAFAVGLALASPELKILGITSAWGDTALRARMLDRLLRETGRGEITVAMGVEKHKSGQAAFSQARWAEREPARAHTDAVDFMLEQIRRYPGEITLVAIAPMTNLAAAIDRDAATFRKLKRIVIMGGSVRVGYDDYGLQPAAPPSAEYNIAMDPEAAMKVLASGVPFYVMPLDATQLRLDEVKRQFLFTRSTPLTDALALLYEQWAAVTHGSTPTLFDDVAVAYVINPALCPVTPLRIRFDAEGRTHEEAGEPNSWVCLTPQPERFFTFYLARVGNQKMGMGTRGQ